MTRYRATGRVEIQPSLSLERVGVTRAVGQPIWKVTHLVTMRNCRYGH